jgi:hypothetical protein
VVVPMATGEWTEKARRVLPFQACTTSNPCSRCRKSSLTIASPVCPSAELYKSFLSASHACFHSALGLEHQIRFAELYTTWCEHRHHDLPGEHTCLCETWRERVHRPLLGSQKGGDGSSKPSCICLKCVRKMVYRAQQLASRMGNVSKVYTPDSFGSATSLSRMMSMDNYPRTHYTPEEAEFLASVYMFRVATDESSQTNDANDEASLASTVSVLTAPAKTLDEFQQSQTENDKEKFAQTLNLFRQHHSKPFGHSEDDCATPRAFTPVDQGRRGERRFGPTLTIPEDTTFRRIRPRAVSQGSGTWTRALSPLPSIIGSSTRSSQFDSTRTSHT